MICVQFLCREVADLLFSFKRIVTAQRVDVHVSLANAKSLLPFENGCGTPNRSVFQVIPAVLFSISIDVSGIDTLRPYRTTNCGALVV